MSLLKYVLRLERMHSLIKRQATGCTDNFAEKMGLSRRQLLEDISDLRQMGAPIKFEVTRQSYVYEWDWNPLSYRISDENLQARGGCNGYLLALAENTFYTQSGGGLIFQICQ